MSATGKALPSGRKYHNRLQPVNIFIGNTGLTLSQASFQVKGFNKPPPSLYFSGEFPGAWAWWQVLSKTNGAQFIKLSEEMPDGRFRPLAGKYEGWSLHAGW